MRAGESNSHADDDGWSESNPDEDYGVAVAVAALRCWAPNAPLGVRRRSQLASC